MLREMDNRFYHVCNFIFIMFTERYVFYYIWVIEVLIKIFLFNWMCYFRWWRESGLPNVNFARHRHVEFFFMACAICEDEKYSAFRSSLAKSCVLATYLDDTYDTYGTVDELELLTQAIKK